MRRPNFVFSVLSGIVRKGQYFFTVTGVLALILIIVSITAGVISRYIFNAPFPWVEELVTFLFIWLSFFGAGLAAAKKKHVVVDILYERLKGLAGKIAFFLTYFVILLFLSTVFVSATILLPSMVGHASVTLSIPKIFYYVPVFLSSFYMLLVYLQQFITAIINFHETGILRNGI
jgi:TRAP-type transport system small permease protein